MINYRYIFFCFLSFGLHAQTDLDQLLTKYNHGNIPYISAEELNIFQSKTDVLLIDTREREEYEVSKIEGAVFAGFEDFSLKQFFNLVTDKTQPVVVYCSLGIRSEIIGEKLKIAGYTNVKNLYGGIFEWKNKDFEVIDSEGKKTEKIHAYSKKWGKWLTNGEKIY